MRTHVKICQENPNLVKNQTELLFILHEGISSCCQQVKSP